jgi:hypothetical protein
VRGLVQKEAVGLVTTHDLALAHIVDSLSPQAANVHFEDHLENGRIASIIVCVRECRSGATQLS